MSIYLKHLLVVFGVCCYFAVHADADVLITDFDNDEILRYDDDGNFLDVVVETGTSPLDGPTALEIGPNGDLFVVSDNNDSIFRYSYPSGQFLGSFTFGGSLTDIGDIQFGPDGNLWVSNDRDILRFDSSTGAFLGIIVFFNGGSLADIPKLKFEPVTGDLFVILDDGFGTDGGDIFRLRFDLDEGVFEETIYQILLPFSSRSFALGSGLGPQGDLFASTTTDSGRIERFDIATGNFLQTFSFNDAESGRDIEIGPGDDIFLVNETGGSPRIERYSGTNGLLIETFIGDLSSAPNDFDFVGPIFGDVNGDGSVDLLDVAPFVELIISGEFQIEADVNQDGVVDLLDVAPFVDLLTGN